MPTSPKILLVLGGTSDIGRATALAFAQAGWTIQLAGRHLEALQRERDDIAARTSRPVTVHTFDVLQTAQFTSFVDALPALPDAVVCAVGLLGDQECSQTDLDFATTVMRSNYEGPSLILSVFAEHFVARGSGMIVGISSVAGERGRASNYTYGAAKAGFTAFLSGLRNRLARSGIRVVTVKPGFVRTRMTANLKLPQALTATPEALSKRILALQENRTRVIYVKPIWKIVMLIIKTLPESIFERTKF